MTQDNLPAATNLGVPIVAQPRLPYHSAIQERFGIDKSVWKALVEAVYPGAKSTDAVILALAYCKGRGLDIMKRVVEIVPMWNSERGCWIETVWPGIALHRITASRTGEYAGHDETQFGPEKTQTWPDKQGKVTITFPEWAQMTVHRFVQGQRVPFPGPRIYWLEAVRKKKNGCPNSMWQTRPYGQVDKCCEAAALRGAFAEELGNGYVAEEMNGAEWHGRPAIEHDPRPDGQFDPQSGLSKAQQMAQAMQQGAASPPAAGPAGPEAGKEPGPAEVPDTGKPGPDQPDPAGLATDRVNQIAAAKTLAEVDGIEKLVLRDIQGGVLAADQKTVLLGQCAARRTAIRGRRKPADKQQSFVDEQPPTATEASL